MAYGATIIESTPAIDPATIFADPQLQSGTLLAPSHLRPEEGSGTALQSKLERHYETVAGYQQRIELLIQYAKDDGDSLNEVSRETFWEFVNKNWTVRRAGLFLMEPGTLRTIWKGPDHEHLALEFLPDRHIHYVIFKQRGPSALISRVSGHDTMDGIMKQVDAFDLKDMLSS